MKLFWKIVYVSIIVLNVQRCLGLDNKVALKIEKLTHTIFVNSRVISLTQKTIVKNPTSVDAQFFEVALPSDEAAFLGEAYVKMNNNQRVNIIPVKATHNQPDTFKLYRVPIQVKSKEQLEYDFIYTLGNQLTPIQKSLPFNVIFFYFIQNL